MRLRLTPRDTSFYDYFTQAANNLVDGANLLSQMFQGAADGSVASAVDREGLAAKLRDAEHANDDVTHAILRQINSTFVTPFDREDIYRLASTLDDVMDLMEAAADLVVLYGIEELPKETAGLVDVLQRCALVTADAMPRLRAMTDLEDYWIEINRLENEADQLYRRLVARLFSGQYDALTVLKLKEVVDQLEATADAFEHVANAIETIAVKES